MLRRLFAIFRPRPVVHYTLPGAWRVRITRTQALLTPIRERDSL